MTAYMLTTDGRGFYTATRCRTVDGAIDRLWERLEWMHDCFEVKWFGAEKQPVEVTAAWLMENCKELVQL